MGMRVVNSTIEYIGNAQSSGSSQFK